MLSSVNGMFCKLLHEFTKWANGPLCILHLKTTVLSKHFPLMKSLCITPETTRGKYRETLQSLGTGSHFLKGHSKNGTEWETNFIGYKVWTKEL